MAERFGQSPYGDFKTLNAAQINVIAAALTEDDTPATPEERGKRDLRVDQPRVKDREVLLALARQNNPDVRDAKAE